MSIRIESDFVMNAFEDVSKLLVSYHTMFGTHGEEIAKLKSDVAELRSAKVIKVDGASTVSPPPSNKRKRDSPEASTAQHLLIDMFWTPIMLKQDLTAVVKQLEAEQNTIISLMDGNGEMLEYEWGEMRKAAKNMKWGLGDIVGQLHAELNSDVMQVQTELSEAQATIVKLRDDEKKQTTIDKL